MEGAEGASAAAHPSDADGVHDQPMPPQHEPEPTEEQKPAAVEEEEEQQQPHDQPAHPSSGDADVMMDLTDDQDAAHAPAQAPAPAPAADKAPHTGRQRTINEMLGWPESKTDDQEGGKKRAADGDVVDGKPKKRKKAAGKQKGGEAKPKGAKGAAKGKPSPSADQPPSHAAADDGPQPSQPADPPQAATAAAGSSSFQPAAAKPHPFFDPSHYQSAEVQAEMRKGGKKDNKKKKDKDDGPPEGKGGGEGGGAGEKKDKKAKKAKAAPKRKKAAKAKDKAADDNKKKRKQAPTLSTAKKATDETSADAPVLPAPPAAAAAAAEQPILIESPAKGEQPRLPFFSLSVKRGDGGQMQLGGMMQTIGHTVKSTMPVTDPPEWPTHIRPSAQDNEAQSGAIAAMAEGRVPSLPGTGKKGPMSERLLSFPPAQDDDHATASQQPASADESLLSSRFATILAQVRQEEQIDITDSPPSQPQPVEQEQPSAGELSDDAKRAIGEVVARIVRGSGVGMDTGARMGDGGGGGGGSEGGDSAGDGEVAWAMRLVERLCKRRAAAAAAAAGGSASGTPLWSAVYSVEEVDDWLGDPDSVATLLQFFNDCKDRITDAQEAAQLRRHESYDWLDDGDFVPEEPLRGRRGPPPSVLYVHGPPGCGKTALVQLCAKIAGFQVDSVDPSELVDSSVLTKRFEAAKCQDIRRQPPPRPSAAALLFPPPGPPRRPPRPARPARTRNSPLISIDEEPEDLDGHDGPDIDMAPRRRKRGKNKKKPADSSDDEWVGEGDGDGDESEYGHDDEAPKARAKGKGKGRGKSKAKAKPKGQLGILGFLKMPQKKEPQRGGEEGEGEGKSEGAGAPVVAIKEASDEGDDEQLPAKKKKRRRLKRQVSDSDHHDAAEDRDQEQKHQQAAAAEIASDAARSQQPSSPSFRLLLVDDTDTLSPKNLPALHRLTQHNPTVPVVLIGGGQPSIIPPAFSSFTSFRVPPPSPRLAAALLAALVLIEKTRTEGTPHSDLAQWPPVARFLAAPFKGDVRRLLNQTHLAMAQSSGMSVERIVDVITALPFSTLAGALRSGGGVSEGSRDEQMWWAVEEIRAAEAIPVSTDDDMPPLPFSPSPAFISPPIDEPATHTTDAVRPRGGMEPLWVGAPSPADIDSDTLEAMTSCADMWVHIDVCESRLRRAYGGEGWVGGVAEGDRDKSPNGGGAGGVAQLDEEQETELDTEKAANAALQRGRWQLVYSRHDYLRNMAETPAAHASWRIEEWSAAMQLSIMSTLSTPSAQQEDKEGGGQTDPATLWLPRLQTLPPSPGHLPVAANPLHHLSVGILCPPSRSPKPVPSSSAFFDAFTSYLPLMAGIARLDSEPHAKERQFMTQWLSAFRKPDNEDGFDDEGSEEGGVRTRAMKERDRDRGNGNGRPDGEAMRKQTSALARKVATKQQKSHALELGHLMAHLDTRFPRAARAISTTDAGRRDRDRADVVMTPSQDDASGLSGGEGESEIPSHHHDASENDAPIAPVDVAQLSSDAQMLFGPDIERENQALREGGQQAGAEGRERGGGEGAG